MGSSDTTRRTGASHAVYVAVERLPIRSCFSWGLPSHEVTSVLVSSYLTVSPFPISLPRQVVFFSVALSADHPAPLLTANSLCEVPTFLSEFPPSERPPDSFLLDTSIKRTATLLSWKLKYAAASDALYHISTSNLNYHLRSKLHVTSRATVTIHNIHHRI